jgi:hypothetical protein
MVQGLEEQVGEQAEDAMQGSPPGQVLEGMVLKFQITMVI